MTDEQLKTCSRCHESKPLDAFGVDRSTKDGLNRRCRECTNSSSREKNQKWRKANPEKRREQSRKYRAAEPEKVRRSQRKSRYKITEQAYVSIVESQCGVCDICHQPFNGKPHLDHDHATGRVRGLLCHGCNLGIGLLGDDPVRLESALEYLLVHRASK